MIIRSCLCVILVWLVGHFAVGQSEDDEIRRYIGMLDKGEIEDVRQALPQLQTRRQNDPGVTYLQARVTTNAIESVKLYQSIVDNFPRSEWADDALFRIYQYYYSMGLYKTADLKLQQLRREYPASEYVTGRREMKLPAKEEPIRLPQSEIQSDTVVDEKTPPAETQQERPNVAPPVTSSRVEPTFEGQYALQMGAFSTAENASKQKAFLEQKGFSVEVRNRVRGGRSLYVVLLGSFKDIEQARAMKSELKTKYKFDSMVVER